MCWKYTKLRLTFSRKKQLSYSSLIILETFKAKNISTIILSSCPMYVCQNLMNLICLTSNCAKFTPYTVNKICSRSGKFHTFISPKLKVLFWSWHIPDSESRRCWFLFSPKKYTTSRFWKYFVYYELDSCASWAKKNNTSIQIATSQKRATKRYLRTKIGLGKQGAAIFWHVVNLAAPKVECTLPPVA